jgi:hypothetical protein
MTPAVQTSPISLAELVAAARAQLGVRGQSPAPKPAGLSSAASEAYVVAAHPGVGASTVSVAILDALAGGSGPRPTLVDLAPRRSSGLLGAAESEVGSDDPRWRAGRRRRASILSAVDSLATMPSMAGPVIIDGTPPTPGARVVLVCRATQPSLGRLMAAVAVGTTAPRAIAVVGASGWPRALVSASRALVDEVAGLAPVVFVPHDRSIELFGIGDAALPRPILTAGRRLADLLWTDASEVSR